jgi:hypothetical protein
MLGPDCNDCTCTVVTGNVIEGAVVNLRKRGKAWLRCYVNLKSTQDHSDAEMNQLL